MSNIDPKNWERYDEKGGKRKVKPKKKVKKKKGKRFPKKQSDYRRQSKKK